VTETLWLEGNSKTHADVLQGKHVLSREPKRGRELIQVFSMERTSPVCGHQLLSCCHAPLAQALPVPVFRYRLPTVKELRAAGRHRVNLHAKNAIEFNTDWGNDIRAKVGAALISIFLRATEVSPVRETRPASCATVRRQSPAVRSTSDACSLYCVGWVSCFLAFQIMKQPF
jgi:hypothetical protein